MPWLMSARASSKVAPARRGPATTMEDASRGLERAGVVAGQAAQLDEPLVDKCAHVLARGEGVGAAVEPDGALVAEAGLQPLPGEERRVDGLLAGGGAA